MVMNNVYRLPLRLKWAILMLGGGHFAGAVFQGQDILVHKTFHCYTVRAKQGGGQSSADGRSGTSHPKSAGASLRRYNEASLANHVKEIVQNWSCHFDDCDLIFYRAASGNKKLLFGNPMCGSRDQPILDKHDGRIRNIPFPTRRATFKEVKRVHGLLISVDVIGNCETLGITKAERTKRKSPTKENPKRRIRRSKSRDSPRRELPDVVMELARQQDDDHDTLAYEVQQQSNDLELFGDSINDEIEGNNLSYISHDPKVEGNVPPVTFDTNRLISFPLVGFPKKSRLLFPVGGVVTDQVAIVEGPWGHEK